MKQINSTDLKEDDYAIFQIGEKCYYVQIQYFRLSQYMDDYYVEWLEIDPLTNKVIGSFQNFFSNINLLSINPKKEEIWKYLI